MKRLILLLLLPAALFSCTTIQPAETSDLNLIVQAPGKSVDELFSYAREWCVYAFVSDVHVIDYERREDGIIIGSFIHKPHIALEDQSALYFGPNGYIRADITLHAKEERVKLSITNPRLQLSGYNNIATIDELQWADFVSARDELADDFEAYIEKRVKGW